MADQGAGGESTATGIVPTKENAHKSTEAAVTTQEPTTKATDDTQPSVAPDGTSSRPKSGDRNGCDDESKSSPKDQIVAAVTARPDRKRHGRGNDTQACLNSAQQSKAEGQSSSKNPRKSPRRKNKSKPLESSDDTSITDSDSDSSAMAGDKVRRKRSSRVSGQANVEMNMQSLDLLRQQLGDLQRQMSDVLLHTTSSMNCDSPSFASHRDCVPAVSERACGAGTDSVAGCRLHQLTCCHPSNCRAVPTGPCQRAMAFNEQATSSNTSHFAGMQQHELPVDRPNRTMQPSQNHGLDEMAAASTHAAKKVEFVRLDQTWNKEASQFEYKETPQICSKNEYEDYLFHIRRSVDSEGSHRSTVVVVRCELLRTCLQDVVGKARSIDFEAKELVIEPDVLFL